MNDPQTIIGVVSAAASWAAVGVMVAQHMANRRTPPPAVQSGPRVIRKAPRRPRRKLAHPVQIGAAR